MSAGYARGHARSGEAMVARSSPGERADGLTRPEVGCAFPSGAGLQRVAVRLIEPSCSHARPHMDRHGITKPAQGCDHSRWSPPRAGPDRCCALGGVPSAFAVLRFRKALRHVSTLVRLTVAQDDRGRIGSGCGCCPCVARGAATRMGAAAPHRPRMPGSWCLVIGKGSFRARLEQQRRMDRIGPRRHGVNQPAKRL